VILFSWSDLVLVLSAPTAGFQHYPVLLPGKPITMSLPGRTTILVVGAGPSGLACAISLFNQGCRDIVVVDALLQGENTSRALIIHAATLEVRYSYVI
jgi:threonine dehydrogenase-like Zn-dependent dehydrogenase